MRRSFVLCIMLGASLPAQADATAVAVVANGTFGPAGSTSCITLAGVTADTGTGTTRARWLGAYWSSLATEPPAGVCDEAQPHEDFESIGCATAIGGATGPRTLYARAEGTDGKTYLLKIADNVPDPVYGARDEIGVVQATPAAEAPLCGAADVPTEPVAQGAVALTAIP